MKSTLFAAFAVALSWAIPAQATPQLVNLFRAIQETGTTLVVDDPVQCKDKEMLGRYLYQRNVVDHYIICVANHNGDGDELMDTVLHEAVHVAQACKGAPLFTYDSIIKFAKADEIQHVATTYPQAQFNIELEARVIAREQDEVYVTTLIKEHCK